MEASPRRPLGAASDMKPLQGRFAQLAYHGSDWRNYYPDKFRARRAMVLAAINKGWTYQDCESVFLNSADAVSVLWLSGSKDQPHSRHEALRRLVGDYKAMDTYAVVNPVYATSAEARQRIGEITADARASAWKGRAGRTDKDVLAGLHRLATRAGTDAVDASVRDLSILSGVTVSTVSRSLKRLGEQGWLTRIKTVQPVFGRPKADRYKLSSPKRVGYYATHDTPILHAECHVFHDAPPVDPGHEVWVRLGKCAIAIYQVLDVAPQSARQLAKMAGTDRRTADRKLPVLAGLGLATKTDNGWSFGTASPHDVVKAEGWTGDRSKVERRKQVIASERESWPWPAKRDKTCASCGYPYTDGEVCTQCGVRDAA